MWEGALRGGEVEDGSPTIPGGEMRGWLGGESEDGWRGIAAPDGKSDGWFSKGSRRRMFGEGTR